MTKNRAEIVLGPYYLYSPYLFFFRFIRLRTILPPLFYSRCQFIYSISNPRNPSNKVQKLNLDGYSGAQSCETESKALLLFRLEILLDHLEVLFVLSGEYRADQVRSDFSIITGPVDSAFVELDSVSACCLL